MPPSPSISSASPPASSPPPTSTNQTQPRLTPSYFLPLRSHNLPFPSTPDSYVSILDRFPPQTADSTSPPAAGGLLWALRGTTIARRDPAPTDDATGPRNRRAPNTPHRPPFFGDDGDPYTPSAYSPASSRSGDSEADAGAGGDGEQDQRSAPAPAPVPNRRHTAAQLAAAVEGVHFCVPYGRISAFELGHGVAVGRGVGGDVGQWYDVVGRLAGPRVLGGRDGRGEV